MAIKVTISSHEPKIKYPCFMRLITSGGVFHFVDENRAYCVESPEDYYKRVGESFTPALNLYEPIPDPFASVPAPSEPKYDFPLLMTHNHFGGVYRFIAPTKWVLIEGGTRDAVAPFDFDADITFYKPITGTVTLSNE